MTKAAFIFALIAQFGILSVYCQHNDNEADWEGCPQNFSVYTKCDSMLHIEALFCNKNHSSICEDYKLDVYTSEDIELSNESSEEFVTSCAPNNDTGCKVSATIGMIAPGIHNITFVAKNLNNVGDPTSQHCEDLITAEDTIDPPFNITADEMNCYNFTLSWKAPIVLPGYDIHGYSIEITDEKNEIVYANNTSDNATSVEIEHQNNFMVGKEYSVSIRTLYCGGVSNKSAVRTFRMISDTIDPPSNITAEVNCYNFNLSWLAPSVLPGYDIHGYSLEIMNENNEIVYANNTSDNATSIEIEHQNNFMVAKEYNVSIRTLYCGGVSNESAVHTFRIINATRVSNDLTYFLATSSEIVIKAKVLDVDCPISHPTSVKVQLDCYDTKKKQQITYTTKNIATINYNGDIIFNVSYYYDQSGSMCEGSLKWMNGFDSESQLQNILLSVNQEFFRAYFQPHEPSVPQNLKIKNNQCFISCCCAANNFCSDQSVPCGSTIASKGNITSFFVSLEDYYLHCDGSYSLSCKSGTIEKTGFTCNDNSSTPTSTMMTIPPPTMATTPPTIDKSVFGAAAEYFSLITMILVCLIIVFFIMQLLWQKISQKKNSESNNAI